MKIFNIAGFLTGNIVKNYHLFFRTQHFIETQIRLDIWVIQL